MTQTFQPGQHPDADQLSAFAEHALPPHEQQQLLAHIADCSDCRALVFLAQEAVPAAALSQAAATHKPLFGWNLLRGWTLAFPAAAALAALVFVTLHLRNSATEDRKAAVANSAKLEQAPAPIPATPPPAQPASPKPTPTESPEKSATNAPIHLDAAKSTAAASFHGSAGPQPPRAYAAGLGGAPAPSTELKTATVSRQSSAGMTRSYGFAAATSPPVAAPIGGAIAGPLPQPTALATDALADQAAANNAPTPARPAPSAAILHSLNQQYSAAPPLQPAKPAATAALPAPAADTVSVSSASAQLETESAPSAGLISSASFGSLQANKARLAKKTQPELPSHRPVLATAASARQQLALDTAGSLFRSQDAGVTWQPVPVQWTGHAVKIALTSSPNPPATAAAKSSPAQPPIFQLTNDAGQLWTSPDGQSWKQK